MSIVEMQPHQMAMLLYNMRFYKAPIIAGYDNGHSRDIAEKIARTIMPGQIIKLIEGKGVFCEKCPKQDKCPIPDDYNLKSLLLLETLLGKPQGEFSTDDLWHVLNDEELKQLERALYMPI